MSEIMTAKINAHLYSILKWAHSLHHVHKCVMTLYLATEHSSYPISFEQFQNTPDFYTAVVSSHSKKEV